MTLQLNEEHQQPRVGPRARGRREGDEVVNTDPGTSDQGQGVTFPKNKVVHAIAIATVMFLSQKLGCMEFNVSVRTVRLRQVHLIHTAH